MTFENFLNMEIGDVSKYCQQFGQYGLDSCFVESDTEEFFLMQCTASTMTIYTMPDLQRAGMLTINADTSTVQKGQLLADTDDAVFVQVYERIKAAVAYKPEYTVSPELTEATTELSPEEAYNAFIQYTGFETVKKHVALYRRVGNENELLFVAGDLKYTITHTVDSGLNRIDVTYGANNTRLLSIGYFSAMEFVGSAVTKDQVSQEVAREVYRVVANFGGIYSREEG